MNVSSAPIAASPAASTLIASVSSASPPASAQAEPSRYAGVRSLPDPASSPRNDHARDPVSPEKNPWLGQRCANTMYVHAPAISSAAAMTEPDTNDSRSPRGPGEE